ncbi:MAG: NTP transferase domain-containing protein [Syntrophorhabdus sp.]|nr:NTP transferase domain-containing protein [Syntrophorhabdus sp.]
MKIVAIIQARMGSSRLPGKVMADIAGKPMIHHVVSRIRRAKTVDLVAVATSTHESDDILASYCTDAGIPCFRGSENDVLDRYYRAAEHFGADIIVRLSSDCPLHDPDVVDMTVRTLLEGEADFVSGGLETTFPDGLDAAAFPMTTLEKTWREATLRSDREHVTTYIHKNPSLFRKKSIRNTEDLSNHRWTVDEPRDLEFVRRVYALLGEKPFGMRDVLELLDRHPEITTINAGISRNEGYAKSLEEEARGKGKGGP